VRPVAGVWASVDSRPVPPARRIGLALRLAGRALPLTLTAVFFLGLLFLGLLAFEAAGRLVGADALLLFGRAARLRAAGRATAPRRAVFLFPVLALRAGFLAMESPIRVIRPFRAAT
jgi:hypothetical protein